MRFVDANIFIRYLTQDDEAKSEAARHLFEALDQGEVQAATADFIVAEVVYVLSSPGLYGLTHEDIVARLRPLISLRGLRIKDKSVCLRALDLYAEHPRIDFADALAVAHMEREGIDEIFSFDEDFDRIAGVTRVVPGAPG